jgi:hypothetical protein
MEKELIEIPDQRQPRNYSEQGRFTAGKIN